MTAEISQSTTLKPAATGAAGRSGVAADPYA
jgi:hypothetical protein